MKGRAESGITGKAPAIAKRVQRIEMGRERNVDAASSRAGSNDKRQDAASIVKTYRPAAELISASSFWSSILATELTCSF